MNIKRLKSIRRVEGLIASLTGIPSSNKDQRGFAAEAKALKAAKYWAGQRIIRRAKPSKRLSPEDMAGTDLLLTLLDGREVNVQVKNYSDFSVFNESRKSGTVPFIIWPDDGEDIARERMLNLIISSSIAGLSPFQLRQTIEYVLKPKQPKRPNSIWRILSRFRKAR